MIKFIVDKILLEIDSELIWLLVAIDYKNKEILGMSISKERNRSVGEHICITIQKNMANNVLQQTG